MERFVIVINRERLYLGWNGTYFLSSDIFDDDVLKFTSLDDAINFIKSHTFLPKSAAINYYKEKHGKVVLYPSKVVPMYNIHKAISI